MKHHEARKLQMRLHYSALIIFFFLSFYVTTASAENITIPNTFVGGTKAVASEVNANFSTIESAINDNDGRIKTLEELSASSIFGLEDALDFLPDKNAAIGDFILKTQNCYSSSLDRYNTGIAQGIEEICEWSERWRDFAYLAAANDEERLNAFNAHHQRMQSLHSSVEAKYEVGLVSQYDVLMAEYYSALSDTVVTGFKAKTGQ